MAALRAQGYEIIIVTNQYTIGEGVITLAQYRAFADALLQKLRAAGVEVRDTFFCPHARDAGCDCCKPRPGLIRRARAKCPEIDPAASFFAGDSPADRELARRCGLKFSGVDARRSLYDIAISLEEGTAL